MSEFQAIGPATENVDGSIRVAAAMRPVAAIIERTCYVSTGRFSDPG